MGKIKLKIGDYITIFLVMSIGVFGFWLNSQGVGSSENKYAVIHVENELIAELSLPPGKSYSYSFNFGPNNEHTGEVEIDDGRIRMEPLPVEISPRLIHFHTGWIEHSYQRIVCLPNKVVVSFRETPSSARQDAIDSVTF